MTLRGSWNCVNLKKVLSSFVCTTSKVYLKRPPTAANSVLFESDAFLESEFFFENNCWYPLIAKLPHLRSSMVQFELSKRWKKRSGTTVFGLWDLWSHINLGWELCSKYSFRGLYIFYCVLRMGCLVWKVPDLGRSMVNGVSIPRLQVNRLCRVVICSWRWIQSKMFPFIIYELKKMCSLIINCYTDWKAIDGSEICKKIAQPEGLEAKKMTTKNA